MAAPRTLAQKIWDDHLVRSGVDEPDLLYIDLHLVHEVTSPQAFDGLRMNGRTVRRPDLTIATEDLEVPHPRMWERTFVLAPLHDVAPDLVDPPAGGWAGVRHAPVALTIPG